MTFQLSGVKGKRGIVHQGWEHLHVQAIYPVCLHRLISRLPRSTQVTPSWRRKQLVKASRALHGVGGAMSNGSPQSLVAVKELKLSYHHGYIINIYSK